MDKRINIMIAGRSREAITELEHLLQAPNRSLTQRWISNGHSNPLYGVQEWPDVLVFHLSTMGAAEIESLLENDQAAMPLTVIVGPANNVECMKLSMKAGVRDYLEEPCDPAALEESVSRLCASAGSAQIDSQPEQQRKGLMTALVSAKGGAGASFLSANLAHIASAETDLSVALIDLDLQFGSLSQYLDLPCEHGLQSALEVAEQLDSMALDGFMSKHESGLRLLSPSENEIMLQRDIASNQFRALLKLLKNSYGHTFVDLPRQIDELSADVYEYADNIILITQQEVASIRDASRLYHLIRDELSIPEEHFRLLINRYDKNSVIELDDICKTVGISKELLLQVPNSYESVAESINVGVPIYEYAKSSRVTRALTDLNAQISGADIKNNPNMMRRMFSNLLRG